MAKPKKPPKESGTPVCPGTQDISLHPMVIQDPNATSIKRKVRLHSVSCNFHWVDFSVEELRWADMQTTRRGSSVLVADLARTTVEEQQDETSSNTNNMSIITNQVHETPVLSDADTAYRNAFAALLGDPMDLTSAMEIRNTEGAHETSSTAASVHSQSSPSLDASKATYNTDLTQNHLKSTCNAPKSTYNAPTSTYNAPKNTYNAPTSTYNAPTSTHSAPKSTYNAPTSTYNAPTSTYSAPKSTYNAPTSTYNAPISTYSAPKSTYNAPTSTYNTPTSTYNAPKSTYNFNRDVPQNLPKATYNFNIDVPQNLPKATYNFNRDATQNLPKDTCSKPTSTYNTAYTQPFQIFNPYLTHKEVVPAKVSTKVNDRAKDMRQNLVNEYEQKLKAQMAKHEQLVLTLQEKFANEKVTIAHDAARNAIQHLESEVQEKMRAMNEDKNKQFAEWKINWLRSHKMEDERKLQACRDTVERDCDKNMERIVAKIRAESENQHQNDGAATAFNQLNNRYNTAMRRLDIIDYAATNTPNKPVKLVWQEATQITQSFESRSSQAPAVQSSGGDVTFLGDYAVQRPVFRDSLESRTSFRRRSSGSSRRSSSLGQGPAKRQRR